MMLISKQGASSGLNLGAPRILTKLKPDSPMEDESTLEWKIALPYIKRCLAPEAPEPALNSNKPLMITMCGKAKQYMS